MANNWNENHAAVVGHLRSTLDDDELALADRLQGIQDRYFGLPRDEALEFATKTLLSSVATQRAGRVNIPGKRRIITICGESNSGKSTALLKHIVRAKELQPYDDENGNTIHPLLMFDAPSPFTPRRLAIDGLAALGVYVDKPENEAWAIFRTCLKSHKVVVLCIDEAQHSIDGADPSVAIRMANIYKGLTQMPDWPLRLVLAGVSPLDRFIAAHRQLVERNYPVRFDPLTAAEGALIAADKVDQVICDHAGLRKSDDISHPDFPARLVHAAKGEFGAVVQLIRDATEICIRDDRDTVKKEDFERAYEMQSGCLPDQNVFTVEHWKIIDVANASLRGDHAISETAEKFKGEKPLKFGRRP